MATVDITQDTLGQTISDNDIVLLDWWAEWCGPCKQFAPTYEAASEKHPEIVFGKVDTEAEQGLAAAGGQDVTLSFTPTLSPMPRGILTTATAVLRPGVDDARVREAYDAAYGDEPFVHVLPEGQWPTTKSVQASNHVALQLAVDHHAGRLVVSTVLDNLTKGTAGAAVQSLNLALGLPETTGLTGQGIAP